MSMVVRVPLDVWQEVVTFLLRQVILSTTLFFPQDVAILEQYGEGLPWAIWPYGPYLLPPKRKPW